MRFSLPPKKRKRIFYVHIEVINSGISEEISDLGEHDNLENGIILCR